MRVCAVDDELNFSPGRHSLTTYYLKFHLMLTPVGVTKPYQTQFDMIYRKISIQIMIRTEFIELI